MQVVLTIKENSMFTLSYKEFVDRTDLSNYTVTFMPGLKAMNVETAKVILNTGTHIAYVYTD
jgi:hypothetical protein